MNQREAVKLVKRTFIFSVLFMLVFCIAVPLVIMLPNREGVDQKDAGSSKSQSSVRPAETWQAVAISISIIGGVAVAFTALCIGGYAVKKCCNPPQPIPQSAPEQASSPSIRQLEV